MASGKRVRIIKKIREDAGGWRFISMKRAGNRYAWDDRPGYYFVEWWDGRKRLRQVAGRDAMEAQTRKTKRACGRTASRREE